MCTRMLVSGSPLCVLIKDQLDHCGVISKFDNVVVSVGQTAFVGVETVQEEPQNAVLW